MGRCQQQAGGLLRVHASTLPPDQHSWLQASPEHTQKAAAPPRTGTPACRSPPAPQTPAAWTWRAARTAAAGPPSALDGVANKQGGWGRRRCGSAGGWPRQRCGGQAGSTHPDPVPIVLDLQQRLAAVLDRHAARAGGGRRREHCSGVAAHLPRCDERPAPAWAPSNTCPKWAQHPHDLRGPCVQAVLQHLFQGAGGALRRSGEGGPAGRSDGGAVTRRWRRQRVSIAYSSALLGSLPMQQSLPNPPG